MMTIEDVRAAYLAAGGTKPAVYLRGYAEAGRFGQSGELSGVVPEDAAEYAAGVAKAQEMRSA